MDDSNRDADEFEHTEDTWTNIKLQLKWWLGIPLYRGLLFGVGHFLSLKVIGPYFCQKLAIKYV